MDLYCEVVDNSVPIANCTNLIEDNENSENVILIQYRLGTVNSNTVNLKFHLIRSYCEILAKILSFHV